MGLHHREEKIQWRISEKMFQDHLLGVHHTVPNLQRQANKIWKQELDDNTKRYTRLLMG